MSALTVAGYAVAGLLACVLAAGTALAGCLVMLWWTAPGGAPVTKVDLPERGVANEVSRVWPAPSTRAVSRPTDPADRPPARKAA